MLRLRFDSDLDALSGRHDCPEDLLLCFDLTRSCRRHRAGREQLAGGGVEHALHLHDDGLHLLELPCLSRDQHADVLSNRAV